ncbi:TPA: tail assembly chaperone [Streptococcus agalactiae]
MKEITIVGKTYPLNFGFDFIREMDKRHFVENNGFKFGTGIQTATLQLSIKNPLILEDIILSATHTLNSIPSKEEIEKWAIKQAEDNKLEEVFEGFLTSLKKAPLSKAQVKQLLKSMN